MHSTGTIYRLLHDIEYVFIKAPTYWAKVNIILLQIRQNESEASYHLLINFRNFILIEVSTICDLESCFKRSHDTSNSYTQYKILWILISKCPSCLFTSTLPNKKWNTCDRLVDYLFKKASSERIK